MMIRNRKGKCTLRRILFILLVSAISCILLYMFAVAVQVEVLSLDNNKNKNHNINNKYIINTFQPITEGLGSNLALHNCMVMLADVLNLKLLTVPTKIAHGVGYQAQNLFNFNKNDDISVKDVITQAKSNIIQYIPLDLSKLNLDELLFSDEYENKQCVSIGRPGILEKDNIMKIISTLVSADLFESFQRALDSPDDGLLVAVYFQRDLHVNYRAGLHFRHTRDYFIDNYVDNDNNNKNDIVNNNRKNHCIEDETFSFVFHYRSLDSGVIRRTKMSQYIAFVKQFVVNLRGMGLSMKQCKFILITQGNIDYFESFIKEFPFFMVKTRTTSNPGNETLSDFILMKNADLLITTTSSFSFLAGMLSDGVIMADTTWTCSLDGMPLLVPYNMNNQIMFDPSLLLFKWHIYLKKKQLLCCTCP